MKICSDISVYTEFIIRGLNKLGVKNIQVLDNSAVDGETIFIGNINCVANRKRFNNSLFSICIGPNGKSSEYADINMPDDLFLEDCYEYFIPALIVARIFGDTDETILNKIKDFLAPNYSIDGSWKSHADIEWTQEKNCFMTVKTFIDTLILDSYSRY
jgi:hypothetical protein